jgi:hypothetical protein
MFPMRVYQALIFLRLSIIAKCLPQKIKELCIKEKDISDFFKCSEEKAG